MRPPDNTEKLKNSAKFIPAPNEKAKKGMSNDSPGRKNSAILGSKLPKSIPIASGNNTETKEMTGKFVPINPKDINVSKGPSLIANIEVNHRYQSGYHMHLLAQHTFRCYYWSLLQ